MPEWRDRSMVAVILGAIFFPSLRRTPQAIQRRGTISQRRRLRMVRAHGFNPGGFDLSSLAADPHDATGKTIYATVMGFAGNGINAAHLYRSTDAGAHWINVSSNFPTLPRTVLSSIRTMRILSTLRWTQGCMSLRRLRLVRPPTAGASMAPACRTRRLSNLPQHRQCLQAMVALASFALRPTDAACGRFHLLTASTAAQPSISLNPKCAYLRHAGGRHGECTADHHGYKYRKRSTDGEPGCDDGRL